MWNGARRNDEPIVTHVPVGRMERFFGEKRGERTRTDEGEGDRDISRKEGEQVKKVCLPKEVEKGECVISAADQASERARTSLGERGKRMSR